MSQWIRSRKAGVATCIEGVPIDSGNRRSPGLSFLALTHFRRAVAGIRALHPVFDEKTGGQPCPQVFLRKQA